METQKFSEEWRDTDFHCVGGGIAGLMAAINAAEQGMDCVVLEKADTRRSGSGGLGNDHFICYIPEVHGDYATFISDIMKLQNGDRLRQMGPEWAKSFFMKTWDIVRLWDEWGIPMKHDGGYYFAGHAVPGRTRAFLKYNGIDQKPILTKQARKRGVKIHNRAMGYELLLDDQGRAAGVFAIDTREYKAYVYRAKAVCLGTGAPNGVFPNANRGAWAMRTNPLNLTGDGRAMAYRAGAELCNMEMPGLHAGVKYFCRNGQATWEGVLRDRDGVPIGPFLEKPDPLYGDITMEVNKRHIESYTKSARSPVYMDMTGLSREQLDLMEHWLRQEGNSTLLRHFRQEGIDMIDTAVEFSTYVLKLPISSGIVFNGGSETCVPGLYAAGDEGYGGISGAAVTGWWAADSARAYAADKSLADAGQLRPKAEECLNLAEELCAREDGAHWLEARMAMENIAWDYCGDLRSHAMLEAGLAHLRRVHARARETLRAENPHELMYCLGMLNLFELAETMFLMADERRESRGQHRRVDYPLQNLMLDGKRHFIRKNGGEAVMSWR